MKKESIAFFDTKPYDRKSFAEVNEKFGYAIKFLKAHLNKDTAHMIDGQSVVCAFVNDVLDSDVIHILKEKGVDLIALRCAGYNNVDLKATFGNMHVVRVPAYSPYAVAEHAVALMMSLNRKTHKAYHRTRDANFAIDGLLGFDMHGKTAGIIGTGKIGRCVVNVLQGFGMRVLLYDPFPDMAYAEEKQIHYVSLGEVYAESDVVTLHCPLTSDTRHLINENSISKMKDGVMIINTGRGPLIDTKALIEGLKNKKVGAAGLDVYEEESDYFFEDRSNDLLTDDVLARLLTFPNVIVTAHQAFFTQEALHNIATITLENVRQFFEEGAVPNEICYRCESVCPKKKGQPCFPVEQRHEKECA